MLRRMLRAMMSSERAWISTETGRPVRLGRDVFGVSVIESKLEIQARQADHSVPIKQQLTATS
jgi:hypothetical protein